MSQLDANFLPWFAVYVKYRHEKTTAVALRSKGYESFLPTYLKVHRDSKKFELPLFPGYVFCRFEVSKILPVLTIPGVFSIVGKGRNPEPISDVDIEGIKRVVTSGLTAYPWPYVSRGQELQVTSGPLRGLQGVVVDASNEKWLVVSIHLLQRSVAVKVERQSISPDCVTLIRPISGPVLVGRSTQGTERN